MGKAATALPVSPSSPFSSPPIPFPLLPLPPPTHSQQTSPTDKRTCALKSRTAAVSLATSRWMRLLSAAAATLPSTAPGSGGGPGESARDRRGELALLPPSPLPETTGGDVAPGPTRRCNPRSSATSARNACSSCSKATPGGSSPPTKGAAVGGAGAGAGTTPTGPPEGPSEPPRVRRKRRTRSLGCTGGRRDTEGAVPGQRGCHEAAPAPDTLRP